jgi:hypothetical protein
MAKQKSPGLPMFNDEQRAQMERWVIENFGGPFTSAPSRRYVDFESGLHGLRLNKASWQLIGRRPRRRWPPTKQVKN